MEEIKLPVDNDSAAAEEMKEEPTSIGDLTTIQPEDREAEQA